MGKKSSKISKVSNSENNSEEKEHKKAKFYFDAKILSSILAVIFILFIMWFAFFIRSGPINLDGLEDNVRANTYAQIQSIIGQQVDAQYPNLNAAYKQDEVAKRYQIVLNTGIFDYSGQQINVEDIVKQNTATLKQSFQADDGQTYLNAIDPYHHLQFATNYYFNGNTGDEVVNGVPWLTTKLAPEGYAGISNPDFHIWLESKLFKFYGITKDSGVGEKTTAIYLIPVFIVMLSVIPCYFIIRKFSNDLFALFGTLVMVSIGTFVSRTIAGFVDTDAYNVLFPLLILVFLIYAFIYKNKILTIILAALAGFFQGFFLWAWPNGWFIFVFIVLALIGFIGYLIINNMIIKTKLKDLYANIGNDLLTLGAFVVSSVIFGYIFIKQNIFSLTLEGISGSVSSIAGISTTNIWPNVLSTVAELNPASFPQIVASVGGSIIFVIAMMGILLLALDFETKNNKLKILEKVLVLFGIIWFILIVKAGLFASIIANQSKIFIVLLFLPICFAVLLSLFNKVNNSKMFLTILLSIWVAGTTYMSLNGVRFILLLGPAFAVSLGIGFYYIAKIINEFISKEFSVESSVKKVIIGFVFTTVLFMILFVPMYTQANAISKSTTPNFDDAWYNAMYKIQNESSQDAMITSWWDFGHFFSAISRRGSSFDGASQTDPKAHWVGRLLMENDEEISHDILQMLVCGGDMAHNTMLNYTKNKSSADAVKVNKIIYSTFGKSNEDTRKMLQENLYYTYDENQIDTIMNYLSCDTPREDFLITSEDMIGKAGVWAHWGSWDFTKKYVYDNYNTKTVELIASDIDENVTLIQKYVDELKAIDKKSMSEDIKRDDLINQWLAPYPSFIPIQGNYEYGCQNQNNSLVCQNGITVDISTGKVSSNYGSSVKFKNLVYPSQNNSVKVVEQDENGDIDVILIPTSNGFNVLLAQTPLGNSLFTKLFYLEGYGTKYFEKFDEEQSVTGVKISVWKVKWNVNEENNLNINISSNINSSKN